MFASDSVPSDTSTDIDDDPWSAIDALTLLQAPMKSSLMVREILAMCKNLSLRSQRNIKVKNQSFFGRIEPEQVFEKTRKVRLNLRNSLITSRMCSE